MDIYTFVGLLSDDSVTIAVWDFTAEDEIFCGSASDASWDFGEYEILGIDITPPDKRGVSVVLNIETEESEEE